MKNPSKPLVNYLTVALRLPGKPWATAQDPLEFALEHDYETLLEKISEATELPLSVITFYVENGEYFRTINITNLITCAQELKSIIPETMLLNGPLITSLEPMLVHDTKIIKEAVALITEGDLAVLTDCNEHMLFNTRFFHLLAAIRFYKILDIPNDCFKYWKFEQGLIDNLMATGHTPKALFSIIVERTRTHVGTFGVLDQILNMSYLSNIIDAGFAIEQLLCLFYLRRIKIDHSNKRRTLNSLWWVMLNNFTTADYFNTSEGSLIDLCRMNYANSSLISNGCSWYLPFYLAHYKQWTDGDDVVQVKDTPIYIHHHTAIEEFVDELHQGTPLLQASYTPTSLKQHPKEVFAYRIEKAAQERYRSVRDEYKGIIFPKLPDSLEKLDKSKWKHLDTPLSLILEGDAMHHCVGGDGYIYSAKGGDVFMHYDDGSKHGLTLELSRMPLYLEMGEDDPDDEIPFSEYDFKELGDAYLGLHYGYRFEDSKTQEVIGYQLSQIHGSYNRNPDEETMKKVLTDLFNCHYIDDRAVIHNAKMEMAREYTYMDDLTTREYYPREEALLLHNLNFVENVNTLSERIHCSHNGGWSVTVQEDPENTTREWMSGWLTTVRDRPNDFAAGVVRDFGRMVVDLPEPNGNGRIYPIGDLNVRKFSNNSVYGELAHPVDPNYGKGESVLFPFSIRTDVDHPEGSREKAVIAFMSSNISIEKQTDGRLITKVFNRLLTSRVLFGFMPPEEIENYTKRLIVRETHLFAPRLYALRGQDSKPIANQRVLYAPSIDETSWSGERLRSARHSDRLLTILGGGTDGYVDFNDPLTRDFLGYHGSVDLYLSQQAV